ncbi:MAG TPA: hypothetical protein VKB57_09660 [Acidimicrobiales bacterium]|nr:hypothetical protein [Acidimicrobiales bacterium]
MGMPAGGRLALAGALLVAAACADDGGGFGPSDTSAPDEAVPWSQAVEVAAARRGEYREAVVVSSDGDSAALSEQWIAYDLDAPFVDRAIAVHVDPKTRRYTSTATRENPSLRFIYTAGSVFMRHPRAQAACGTAWIEIPPEELAQAAGATFDASRLQDLEPLDLLRSAKDPGPPVRTDGRGSVYEVPAPGTTGLALSVLASRPGLADRIAAEQRTAEVRVPRGGGPVEITIDLTDVMADVAGTTDAPVGFRPDVELTWTVTAPVAAVPTTVPTDAATREECSAAGG